MNVRKGISYVAILATVVLLVLAVLRLPATVVTQFSASGNPVGQMPKALAITIPAFLGLGGGVCALLLGEGKKGDQTRCLIASAAGIAVFIIMLMVNR